MQKMNSAKARLNLAYPASYYTQQSRAISVAALSAQMLLSQQQRQ